MKSRGGVPWPVLARGQELPSGHVLRHCAVAPGLCRGGACAEAPAQMTSNLQNGLVLLLVPVLAGFQGVARFLSSEVL